ncbi:MAG: hypothetical protein IKL02_05940 [Kiritimatiellae bacterium]|nr:hypothetical protein [Kiritimatiellia bacterium]
MAYTWNDQPTARLTVRKQGTSDTFGFEGVNASNSAGTPEQFLAAANRILNIGGLSAVITDITRTKKEKGVES